MSTIYAGDGANPSPTIGAGTKAAIASSTNASPIHVLYSSGPGYNTGDTIEIEGHRTNTNANGVWQITKVSATEYILNGSTGNGVGGATGYSTDFQVLPAVQIPSSGDLVTAASVATVGENGADFMPWAYRRMGAYRLMNVYQFNTAGAASALGNAWSQTNITSSNTYTELTNATHTSPLFTFAAPAPVAQTNDILIGEFHGSWFIADAGTHTYGGIRLRFSEAGNPAGSLEAAQVSQSTTLGAIAFPVSLKSYLLVGATLAGGDVFNLYLEGAVVGRTDCSISMVADYDAFIYHYRPN